MRKAIVISGPSGSGKTTIVKKIEEECPSLEKTVSATTRKKRDSEIDGKDYYFFSDNGFREKIERNEFAEFQPVYDYFYGTPRSEAERIWNAGKIPVFVIEVQGYMQLKKEYGDKLLGVFILPPGGINGIDTLKERITERASENENDLNLRIERSAWEIEQGIAHYDRIIPNNTGALDETVRMVKKSILDFLAA